MSRNEPDADGERGAIVGLASVAAFDGQIGQAAYASSKGGIVGLTLPVARDLSASGIRLNTVAPGLIDTPIYGEGEQAEEFKAKLGESVLFPKRLGHPDELARDGRGVPDQPLHERRRSSASTAASGCPRSSRRRSPRRAGDFGASRPTCCPGSAQLPGPPGTSTRAAGSPQTRTRSDVGSYIGRSDTSTAYVVPATSTCHVPADSQSAVTGSRRRDEGQADGGAERPAVRRRAHVADRRRRRGSTGSAW